MKPRLVVAVLITGTPPMLAAQTSAPTYSIDDYCESVSQAIGGSYTIKAQCVKEENAALSRVQELGYVEERITKYCAGVAQAIGGSYTIYEQCLKEESEAKAQ